MSFKLDKKYFCLILSHMKNKVIDKTRQELRDEELAAKSSRPGNQAFMVSRKMTLLRVFLLILSGAVCSAAFPPLAWSFLSWVSLIPLYLFVSDRTFRGAFCNGFIWGYFWALTSFFWMREIEVFIPFVMALILALFPACWAMMIPVFKRSFLVPLEIQLQGSGAEMENPGHPKLMFLRETLFIIAAASWWCLLEWVRSWFLTGFPWNFLGVSQWKNIPLIQICEYTGVYGISFLIVYFNIAMVFAGKGIRNSIIHGRYRRPVSLIIGVVILMLSILIGAKSMLKYRSPAKGAKGKNEHIKLIAAVIQGNIPQCRFPKIGEAEFALNEYVQLSRLAAINKPDILIWSETAVPVPYFSGHPFGTIFRFELSKLQKASGIPLLFGTIDFGTEFSKYSSPEDIPGYNAVFLLDGRNQVVDRYYKQHLVPFGEYTPLGKYYPEIKKYFGMGRDLSAGTRSTLFELKKGVMAGAQICFEDVFPGISRDFVHKGANLLVVLSNDAWYPESSEAEQHMANSIFRAVENRRPMIRAGNNNCSCLILPNGVIADSVSLRQDEAGEYVPAPELSSRGYADFTVEIDQASPLTFYTKYGDIFILLCGLVVVSAAIHSLWIWREKKSVSLNVIRKDKLDRGKIPSCL